jgi:excisionase family DNA binding protein
MFSLTEHIKETDKDISVISRKQMMRELNISRSTIYRWCKYQDMPHYKVKQSNKILFNRNKVQDWLENQ